MHASSTVTVKCERCLEQKLRSVIIKIKEGLHMSQSYISEFLAVLFHTFHFRSSNANFVLEPVLKLNPKCQKGACPFCTKLKLIFIPPKCAWTVLKWKLWPHALPRPCGRSTKIHTSKSPELRASTNRGNYKTYSISTHISTNISAPQFDHVLEFFQNNEKRGTSQWKMLQRSKKRRISFGKSEKVSIKYEKARD